ncbi:MAG: hypothetical protein JWM87_4676 [Candidatus Eremiobacteraeota bacterium]|nr:hypothetical protein [Candidatus Eremiobacteraeota bacterium]
MVRQQSVTAVEGCDSRVHYDLRSGELVYWLSATCRGGISIAQTSITFTSYDWNTGKEDGRKTESPVCTSVGPATCKTAETLWPLVNNRSEYARISNVYTIDNKGYKSVQPDGAMKKNIPINDKIVPYPLIVTAGFLVPDPVDVSSTMRIPDGRTLRGGRMGGYG